MEKHLPASAGEEGSIPGSARSPGEGNGNPLQYSCLGNPMGRGARWVTVHEVAESEAATEHGSRYFLPLRPGATGLKAETPSFWAKMNTPVHALFGTFERGARWNPPKKARSSWKEDKLQDTETQELGSSPRPTSASFRGSPGGAPAHPISSMVVPRGPRLESKR